VLICTEVFLPMAELELAALGMRSGSMPMVVLPHPFGTLSAEEVQALADSRVTEVVDLVFTSAD
jgi:hypothetical protein